MAIGCQVCFYLNVQIPGLDVLFLCNLAVENQFRK